MMIKRFILAVLLLFTLNSSASRADERQMRHDRLAAVSKWFYILNFNIESEMVSKIARSKYDMVVTEPIFTEKENTGFDVAGFVKKLKGKSGSRLVIAYIDIGEAEEWRTYWKKGWRIGNPKWIVADDPDGWEGNFPVAYWHRQWRKIWLGRNGIIEKLVAAGFDGVYLDWIEAFSDDNVIHAAKRDKINPRAEMIRFIADIAALGRRHNSQFLVIAQNAAELATDNDYVRIIDAIAQEQVWFDGGADNVPPGDCPLPKTDDDIDSRKYIKSLPKKCRRQYRRYPDSTLHVSSREYIDQLLLAKSKGLVIFTVDYALQRKNIDKAYRNARQLGFIPFTSERGLTSFHPAR